MTEYSADNILVFNQDCLEGMSVGNRRANYYLSCKLIKAVPKKNDKDEDGYQIFYPDGYVSWCPKSVFEDSYRDVTEFADSLLARGDLECKATCFLHRRCDDGKLPECVDVKSYYLTLDF